MLALKSNLGTHALPNQAIIRSSATSISDIPPEILDLILECLYQHSHRRLDTILPSSRTSRQFRKSSLPLLFETFSCVIRENAWSLPHLSFCKAASQPHLLQHVKTLHLRKPLVTGGKRTICDAEAQQNRLHDVGVLEAALKRMPQLQQIKLCCSLYTTIDVLRFLQPRKDITIVVDHVSWFTAATMSEHQSDLVRLLRGRTAALGRVYMPMSPPLPNDATGIEGVARLPAIDLGTGGPLDVIPWEELLGDSTNPTFPNTLSHLQELWLGQLEPSTPDIPWPKVLQTVPWGQLRRLRFHGAHLQRRLHDITPKLTGLEDLRLNARKLTPFHANCSYSQFAIYSDVNYPYFDLDFASLPSLRVLEIEGICNHVPIQNVVGPNLRALRLHKPEIRYSVMSSESQRSPSDLVNAAKIAPRLERLELDIGYVENLWHPTAIPGVDVDVELYRFLSALSNFKLLKVLRLFPPYVAKDALHPQNAIVRRFCQPLSDEQAVRMFNRIRMQCPKLDLFSISVSSIGVSQASEFSPMNWEIRPWGDKTVMTTRQLGKDYELRQVWVGERRLTWETRRHAYSKKHISDPEDWLLTRAYCG